MRGLDVRVLVPKLSDSHLVTAATRSYFDKLFRAGVRVYLYGPRMLHTKALLVDEDTAIIGTSNFDTRSFSLNFEIVVRFCDTGVAGKLRDSLELDLAAAEEVTRDSPTSGAFGRFKEASARLFAPLL
jgi:cardiolipin synthase